MKGRSSRSGDPRSAVSMLKVELFREAEEEGSWALQLWEASSVVVEKRSEHPLHS